MSQFFAYRDLTLGEAPLQIRVLVTAFVVLVSLGVAVGMVNYQVRTGLSARGSAAWYRGQPAAGADAEVGRPDAGTAPAGGAGEQAARNSAPGGSLAPTPLREKSPLELLDASHPHLFNEAFLFFVLGHLVALCAVSDRLKIGLYLAGFAGVLVDVAAPWLIRYVAPEFAYLQLLGHVLVAGAFLGMVVVPLWEMWTPPAGGRTASRKPGARKGTAAGPDAGGTGVAGEGDRGRGRAGRRDAVGQAG